MRNAILLSGLVCFGFVVSCRSQVEHAVNPKPGVAVETSESHVPQFSDIPTPSDFVFENDNLRSYVQEAGHWRNGRLVYSGQGRALDAVQYFEERLPHHGWTLTDRKGTGDAVQLDWKKGDTSARIDVAPTGVQDRLRITVQVSTRRDPVTTEETPKKKIG